MAWINSILLSHSTGSRNQFTLNYGQKITRWTKLPPIPRV
jgi:hypothetical protein